MWPDPQTAPEIVTGTWRRWRARSVVRDHHRDRGVGLEAAVEQPERLDDPARREVVVHRERRAHERALVQLRVATLGDRDRAEVLGVVAPYWSR